ncbi:sugar-binding transcriptional regulator [Labrys monachus]|uniref:DNA-binding transcriptional regulator LsrR (DeoR family) n=1 Tax=Labrys monachus TaxID=217067 RepID=A0ABU0FCZ9_9HYPH|nr:sugar-binding domain-containing protein [Labrys monachus]MDQ0392486.1 DNA-binding transcriptional regulator LsrR (DeoR family) [Labrys monachus]
MKTSRNDDAKELNDRPDVSPSDRKLELAARAAWLYHAKGRRQDQIALELNISRQIVQRLIALAASEKLIRFQLIHPLSECIELAERLRQRFELIYCDVAPAEKDREEDISTVATAAAFYLENLLQQKAPITIGVGNGAAMRETTLRIPPLNRPQHKFVSLMGNLTRHGRASHYDVVMRLSERVGAQCYPLPMPVVTNTVAEREVLQAQLAYQSFLSLVEEASVLMMGIGYMGWQAPLHLDGFITDVELGQAMEAGAIGELLGHGIDASGRLVSGGYHDRLTSFLLQAGARRPTMIVQSGTIRVPAIRAALDGRLANSLITDENTARRLLEE